MTFEELDDVLRQIAHAVGSLVIAFIVFQIARLVQLNYTNTRILTHRERKRHASFRGGVDGVRENAAWLVEELLSAGHIGLKSQDEGMPPEWERLYPSRAVAYDFDHAGTTCKLTTADMIGIRWGLPLNVSMELGLFADLIVRDFILCWYSESISKEPQFPDDVRSVLQSVLGKLGDRILRINLPMFILCDISYVLRHHLRWFSELKKRARKRCHPESEFDIISQEDRNKLIMEEFRRAGHLHPACSITGEPNDPRTMSYVRSITSELLVRLLPEADYHCAGLRHLVREVLTCNILVPTLESVTPDVLNSVILQLLRGSDEDEEDDPDATHNIAEGSDEYAAKLAHGLSEAQESADASAKEAANTTVTSDTSSILSPQMYAEPDSNKFEVSPVLSASKRDERSVSTMSANTFDLGGSAERTDFQPQQSIDFIHEADAAMRREEAGRLMVDLQSVLSESVAQFTSSPDNPLGNDSPVGMRLLEVLDRLLSHGTKQLFEEKSAAVMSPWWEYVRKAGDIVPPSAMPTNAVDSVLDALVLDADHDANPPNLDSTTSTSGEDNGKDNQNQQDDENDANKGKDKPNVPSKEVSQESNQQQQQNKSTPSPTSNRSSKRRSRNGILTPGRAWLAMMLKHKLLAETIQALLQDHPRTDLHYTKSAAIRAERLVPTLATLNGVNFDFNLQKFWEHASRVRSQLENKGITIIKQEGLRKLRQRVRKKLAKQMKTYASSVPDQAIVALQDRVGAIRSVISGFTVKSSGRSSYVQYIITLSLTRRVDGGVATWTIYRRYSRFYELHHALRNHYGYQFDDVDLPKKGGIFSSQNMSFINSRKEELAKYLEKVLEHPVVCDSEEVLTFISPETAQELTDTAESMSPASHQDTHLNDGSIAEPHVETSLPDPSGEPSRLGLPQHDEAETTRVTSTSPILRSPVTSNKSTSGTTAAASAGRDPPKLPRRPSDPRIGAAELQNAEDHMYKLAQEIFEFHELSLLRRNLISITRNIVSLVFQGSAQRWLRDNYTRDASAKLFAKLLATVRELLWPNGEFGDGDHEASKDEAELKAEVNAAELRQRRDEALQEILDHIPQPMAKFMGKDKAHRCVRKLHEFLQHPTLIHNLLFTSMDLLLLRIFPDLPLKALHHKLR